MKTTVYWAPFLHFYQPPTQFHAVLRKICDESYRPLVRLFQEHRDARVTINLSGVLTEMLNDHGAADVVSGFRELAENQQLEFCESSKYHAILPLIPEKEIFRQIRLNHETNKRFFGESYRPQGFFLPEMCYSEKVNQPLTESGYRWILLGGVACSGPWPQSFVYRIRNTSLLVFFRDDILSNKISFKGISSQGFLQHLKALAEYTSREKNADAGKAERETNIYVVTAMDGETFGHHIQNWEKLFLEEVYEGIRTSESHPKLTQRVDLAEEHRSLLEAEDLTIKVVTISELLKIFPEGGTQAPRASSWSTSPEEIERGIFYPLWKHPDNFIHSLQWDHLEICLSLVETAEKHQGENEEAKNHALISRRLLDQALHSCQFWWASGTFRWDVNMIHKGMLIQEEVMLNACKAVNLGAADRQKKKECYYQMVAARDIRNKLIDRLI